MKNIFALIALVSFSNFASASNVGANDKVAQMILNNSAIMASVNAKIKSLLPRLTMKFSGIEVNSSATKYSAIMTYTDTAKGTFFNPSFGDCSVLVRGKIITDSTVSADSIREYDCGE
jgi:hypothetical protein